MLDITYEYYVGVYGGSQIEEKNFKMVTNRTIAIANGYLTVDLYKLNEADYTPDELTQLKTAICAASECTSASLVPGSNEAKQALSGESVAGVWSRSYSTASTGTVDTMRQGIYAILEDFLSGSAFLTRGYYISG